MVQLLVDVVDGQLRAVRTRIADLWGHCSGGAVAACSLGFYYTVTCAEGCFLCVFLWAWRGIV